MKRKVGTSIIEQPAKEDFEIICAFVLLKAAIKVAEEKEDVALLSALNHVLIPVEFAFNLLEERKQPSIKRRNWIGGFVDGGVTIVDTPHYNSNGEKVLNIKEQERLIELIKANEHRTNRLLKDRSRSIT